MLSVIGCASSEQSAYRDVSGPDAGLIEIANRSPQYLLSIAVFESSEECRGLKYVAELEKFELKAFRASHRETLSLWVTYTEGNRRGVKGCGAIYSLPFVEGDLRVVTEAPDQLKQCTVSVSSSQDGRSWAPVPGFRKRIGRSSVLGEDPRCERE